MFFERGCPICRRPARAVCDTCWGRLEPAPVRWLAGLAPDGGRDLEVRPLFAYTPESAAMLLAAKNGGRRQVLRQLGRAMARELAALDSIALDSIALDSIDAVTWVPASAAHRRVRGFDQGRLLARTIAAGLDLPARSFLTRASYGDSTSQKGKGRDERRRGATIVATRPVTGRLLLIDDVITTGTSLRHGADALFAAGASSVVAAVAASADRHRLPASTAGTDLPITSATGSDLWPAARVGPTA